VEKDFFENPFAFTPCAPFANPVAPCFWRGDGATGFLNLDGTPSSPTAMNAKAFKPRSFTIDSKIDETIQIACAIFAVRDDGVPF